MHEMQWSQRWLHSFIQSVMYIHTHKRMFNSSCCMRFFPVSPLLALCIRVKSDGIILGEQLFIRITRVRWLANKWVQPTQSYAHILITLVLMLMRAYSHQWEEQNKKKKKLCKMNGAWVIFTHIELIRRRLRCRRHVTPLNDVHSAAVNASIMHTFKSDDAKNANRRANVHTHTHTHICPSTSYARRLIHSFCQHERERFTPAPFIYLS